MGKLGYTILVFLLVSILSLSFYTPYLAFSDQDSAETLYQSMSWACHQKISRSQCLFYDGTSYYIGDCLKQEGKFYPNDSYTIGLISNVGHIGYKLVVCARDMGIYSGMLVAALIYPFYRRLEDDQFPPPLFYILALVPIGLDGVIQLLSHYVDFYSYESTNTIRTMTGFIAGFATSFYLIPIMNKFGKKGKN